MTTTYTCIRCGLTDDSVFNLDGSTAHRELFVCISKLRQHCADVEAERDEVTRERGELRQRVQVAEKAARTTIEECRPQGVSIGRSLANYAAEQKRQRADRAEAILAALREPSDEVLNAALTEEFNFVVRDALKLPSWESVRLAIRAAVAAAEQEANA